MKSPYLFNRELSWLEFNARVLEEALDASIPLLERLKFLSIVTSNFDEFFMVRVASLKALVRSGSDIARDPSGLTPEETLAAIAKRTREIVGRQYDCLLREILPGLALRGFEVVRPSGWKPQERRWLEAWFSDRVAPLLTPLRVEGDETFQSAGNLRVHAAFLVRREDGGPIREGDTSEGAEEAVAIVQVPPNLDRFIRLPSGEPGLRFALVDDLVRSFGARLFPGYEVRDSILFKVTRDADIGVDEDRDDDFLAAMEEVIGTGRIPGPSGSRSRPTRSPSRSASASPSASAQTTSTRCPAPSTSSPSWNSPPTRARAAIPASPTSTTIPGRP